MGRTGNTQTGWTVHGDSWVRDCMDGVELARGDGQAGKWLGGLTSPLGVLKIKTCRGKYVDLLCVCVSVHVCVLPNLGI